MREDIKKQLTIHRLTIKENSNIVDDELISMIKDYRGDNKMIIDFQGKVIKNFDLTPRQKEVARDFFSNDKLKKTILSSLDYSNDLGKKVIRKGIETYLSLLKTSKKYLFKPKEGRNVKVDRPSEGWIIKNINDLEEFKKKLSNEQLSQWVELADGGGILKNKIDEVLDILQNNPESFFGFIENGDWSVVNKIDTNTINWFRMIAELDAQNKLKGNTPEEKVEFFFEQTPVEKLLHTKSLNGLKELEEQYGIKIPTLSLAEYEVLKDFNIDFQNVKKRIMKSTEPGDKNEENIRGTIKLFLPKESGQSPIIDFSSPGNRVDQVFGVDMMVNMYVPELSSQKYWVPVQAKSSMERANKSLLLKNNIGGIAIFPTKNPELKEKGDYAYLTRKNGTEKSLTDLLDYNREMNNKKGG